MKQHPVASLAYEGIKERAKHDKLMKKMILRERLMRQVELHYPKAEKKAANRDGLK